MSDRVTRATLRLIEEGQLDRQSIIAGARVWALVGAGGLTIHATIESARKLARELMLRAVTSRPESNVTARHRYAYHHPTRDLMHDLTEAADPITFWEQWLDDLYRCGISLHECEVQA